MLKPVGTGIYDGEFITWPLLSLDRRAWMRVVAWMLAICEICGLWLMIGVVVVVGLTLPSHVSLAMIGGVFAWSPFMRDNVVLIAVLASGLVWVRDVLLLIMCDVLELTALAIFLAMKIVIFALSLVVIIVVDQSEPIGTSAITVIEPAALYTTRI